MYRISSLHTNFRTLCFHDPDVEERENGEGVPGGLGNNSGLATPLFFWNPRTSQKPLRGGRKLLSTT